MTLFQILQTTSIPCVYSHFRDDDNQKKPKDPPYIAYVGSGQDTFKADNTIYHKKNSYRVEYYFSTKDETKEDAIETALLTNGYIYEKSDDIFIQSEGVFVIYYYI